MEPVAAATDMSVLKAIGAGIAAMGMIGSGIGLGLLTGHYFDAVARQPEVQSKITAFFFIGAALTEAIALFAFAIAAMILFV
ncbi:MAG: ATP synthase F0 subunit C [Alphaproteobacteria bacterium]